VTTPDPPSDKPGSGSVYTERQMDRIAARWDSKAAVWDENLKDPACHLNEDGAYDRFLEELLGIIQARRRLCSTQGIIDAGCATGLVLAKVISLFAWGVGLDISPEMIKRAQAKHVQNASFIIGDCFDISRNCQKAGTVVSRGVLLSHYGHHQGEILLRSARAALVEGGFILWDFLNRAGRAKFQHVPRNKTFFDPPEIYAIARRAGFGDCTIIGDADRRVGLLFAQ
jgi:SAM-dependent methyltransferase